jgi:hypothetical protein
MCLRLCCRRAQWAAKAAAEPVFARLPACQLCSLHGGVRLCIIPPVLPDKCAQKRGNSWQGDGLAVAQWRHHGSVSCGEVLDKHFVSTVLSL